MIDELPTLIFFGITIFVIWLVNSLFNENKDTKKNKDHYPTGSIYNANQTRYIKNKNSFDTDPNIDALVSQMNFRMKNLPIYPIINLDEVSNPKFKTQKSINKNIKDPITGETLDIVVCHCGTTYHKDTFSLYGCDCDSKLLNKK